MMTQVTGDSPQAVALRLTEAISALENKSILIPGSGADKPYALALYKECLNKVLSYTRWGPYST